MPARCTLSPISMKARSAVSGESVSVPRKRAMLVRRADRLHRQEHHGRIRRQQRAHARQIRFARCRYRRRREDAARAARPPRPAAPRCGRRRTPPSSAKASRSRAAPSVPVRRESGCHRFQIQCLTGSPRFRQRRDATALWSARTLEAPGAPDDARILTRRALIAATLACASRRNAQTARQGVVRHQLGRRGRAWRLLPGGRGRHLREVRPRRDHRAGRPAGEQPPAAAVGQDRFLHERQHRCRASTRSPRTFRPSWSRPRSRRSRRCCSPIRARGSRNSRT